MRESLKEDCTAGLNRIRSVLSKFGLVFEKARRLCAAARRAAHITGIGAIGASAFTAAVGDFKQRDSGARRSARVGLVPRRRSRPNPWRDGTCSPHQARRLILRQALTSPQGLVRSGLRA